MLWIVFHKKKNLEIIPEKDIHFPSQAELFFIVVDTLREAFLFER